MRRLTVLMSMIMVALLGTAALCQVGLPMPESPASGSALQAVTGFVLHPWVAFILVFGGMMLVITELAGFRSWGATGTAGVLCVGSIVGSSIVAGVAAWSGVALLLAGVALLLVESRVLPGRGVSVVGGLICLFFGLFLTLGTSDGLLYPMAVSALFTILSAVAFLVHLPMNSAWRITGRRLQVSTKCSCTSGAETGHAQITRLDGGKFEEQASGHDLGHRSSRSDNDDQQTIHGTNVQH